MGGLPFFNSGKRAGSTLHLEAGVTMLPTYLAARGASSGFPASRATMPHYYSVRRFEHHKSTKSAGVCARAGRCGVEDDRFQGSRINL